ncbi:MAG: hypothetical protein M3Q79_03525 [bacterium]|nr:hypothetical protein [bacterium]
MPKKPTVKKSTFIWHKPQTWSKLLIVLFLVVLFLAVSFVWAKYGEYKEKRKITQIVADFRIVKSDLENVLGLSFEERATCTQNQGKYDGPGANWGCSIWVSDELNTRADKRKQIDEVMKKYDFFKNKFSSRTDGLGDGYSYAKEGVITTCGSEFYAKFIFSCSFGVSNKNSLFAKQELNLE